MNASTWAAASMGLALYLRWKSIRPVKQWVGGFKKRWARITPAWIGLQGTCSGKHFSGGW